MTNKDPKSVVELNLNGLSEEAIEMAKEIFARQVKRECYVYMLYESECGCEGYQTILIDRYPMSPTILCICTTCHKGTKSHPLQPYKFHIPSMKLSFDIQELAQSHIEEGDQKYFLEQFKKEYLSNMWVRLSRLPK